MLDFILFYYTKSTWKKFPWSWVIILSVCTLDSLLYPAFQAISQVVPIKDKLKDFRILEAL